MISLCSGTMVAFRERLSSSADQVQV